ncbi:hypothetical protein SAMN05421644_1353 [Allochromatium warmingii]|uniref:Uncharacterized protein n=1 Tax=Allochromatium warmingii TaxID=61595 RepID=A0A1H3HQJ1_ALLWA|nr:hypothetical protein SAMN05421644_1353 [Allochromatium warmingii]
MICLHSEDSLMTTRVGAEFVTRYRHTLLVSLLEIAGMIDREYA